MVLSASWIGKLWVKMAWILFHVTQIKTRRCMHGRSRLIQLWGEDIFARKLCIKINKMLQFLRDICQKTCENARIFMMFAQKFNKISEFYMIFARKMPEFYMIIV